ncbi:pyridoxal phosphate-dependent decarboxylase family protein [Commensalibacter oyaizuii]|uniref:Aminotransferase class V-fold PLP-dependent enzyme n=1 Tax=Commensalibacter oyaizuii TaxID=3043873 RepID=A0ABT6Q325_9PROT|nr:aminotransferase class V-fold PLP-dependent enzyme [Commensalibacter sp. TBRC 16381]MDI2090899.1 aminotransferase class V-fold PLP-dependent enzyme [Commensalibacter sp. TBRC 16381]
MKNILFDLQENQLSNAVNHSVLYDAFNPSLVSDFLECIDQKITHLLQDKSKHGVHLIQPSNLMNIVKQLTTKDFEHKTPLERFNSIIDLHIRTGIRVNSTGYMARQFSSVVPVAAMYDMVASICPQPASFYECGPLPNVADKIMAEEFSHFLGWEQQDFDMISTSGASLANLTAVTAARNLKFPDILRQGTLVQGSEKPAIAIGADSHFSVSRLAGILGIGQDNIVILPINKKRQICIRKAQQALQQAKAKGLRVFCIIGSAGTTSVGAIDPLKELADLAHQYDAWFHVDAAHSGAFLVSDQLRSKVKDLSYADSFCLDAHKTLFVPAACTLLFYKNAAHSNLSFPSHASYVSETDEISRFESGTKNFECTKRPSILNLWVAWTLYGRTLFEEKLNYLVEITAQAYNYIQSLNDFEVLHAPESNILCFRYVPKGVPDQQLNQLQLKIWNVLRTGGRHFISKVDLDDVTALRIVIMNHEITINDVIDLIINIRKTSNKIIKL